MRRILSFVSFFGLVAAVTVQPSLGQITSGNENEQDAIRFERQKQAAAERQARLESRRSESSSADRDAAESRKVRPKTRNQRKGSAERSSPADERKEK